MKIVFDDIVEACRCLNERSFAPFGSRTFVCRHCGAVSPEFTCIATNEQDVCVYCVKSPSMAYQPTRFGTN